MMNPGYQKKLERERDAYMKALGFPTIFAVKYVSRCKCDECVKTPNGPKMRPGDRAGFLDDKLMSITCIDRIIKKRWACPDCRDTGLVKINGKYDDCDCPNKPRPNFK